MKYAAPKQKKVFPIKKGEVKEYVVNVHYDFCAQVSVKAENEEDAMDQAKKIADNIPQNNLEYCDFIGACIID